MKCPIYLDYAATTPVDPRVAEAMSACLTMDGIYANPASIHSLGRQAHQLIEQSREQVAALLNAEPREFIWTSGATESDNLAIKGVARFYQSKGRHIITCKTEHKAVLDSCGYLETQGFEITYLDVGANGLIDCSSLEEHFREDTILVSVMHINNETGVIQDIQRIGELCRQRGIIFHVDAAQSIGKISLDISKIPVDLISLASHKIYGPKGVGALYVRHKPRARLAPLIHGGGHEQGLRSGTLATHQLVGLGKALEIANIRMQEDYHHIRQLSHKLLQSLESIEGLTFNSDMTKGFPGIINFSVCGVDGSALLMALKDLAISSGSACTSTSIEPSYVLRAMGVKAELAYSSLRLSIGRFTTEEDIDYACQYIPEKIAWLRGLSPLWEIRQER